MGGHPCAIGAKASDQGILYTSNIEAAPKTFSNVRHCWLGVKIPQTQFVVEL